MEKISHSNFKKKERIKKKTTDNKNMKKKQLKKTGDSAHTIQMSK